MKTISQQTDLSVAKTIAQQIGNRAFQMMGTMNKMGTANSLVFNLRGSPLGIDKIEVILQPSDTYTLRFWRLGCGKNSIKLIDTVEGVYADGLHLAIESKTGLRLSL